MADLKIITHTTYTYETTDGRSFDNKPEAEAWQNALDNADTIVMLDSRFNLTTEVEMAYHVFVKDQEQVDAFNVKQEDLGIASIIPEPGYYYYDEVLDEYISVDKEIERLLGIKNKLDSFAK
jgi:dsDNA-binding SOS-regulon protein